MDYCVVLLLISVVQGAESQLEWECSILTNGVYYFPNFETTNILNPSSNNLWDNSADQTSVYPIPASLSCAGTVTALEFCFRVHSNSKSMMLQVLTLSTMSQRGTLFHVENSIAVYTTPENTTCTGNGQNTFCCSSTILNAANHFQLPQSNFAVGITVTNSFVPCLQIFESSYNVEVFQKKISLVEGVEFDFGPSISNNFQAVRLHITPLSPTTSSTTMSTSFPTTTVATNVDMTSDTPGTDSAVPMTNTESITSIMNDSESISTFHVMSDSVSDIQETTELPDVSPEDLPSSSLSTNAEMGSNAPLHVGGLDNSAPQVGPIIGGAVGGVIALILAVIMVVLLLMVCRGRKLFKGEDNGKIGTISNVIYDNRGISNSEIFLSKSAYDYAEVGPNANGSSSTSKKQGEEVYYSAVPDEKSELVPKEYEDFQTNKEMTLSTPMEYDDIYIAPASDVKGLYAQLEDILSDDVCRQNIRLGHMLGSGQFGEVYRGVWERSHNNLEVAVKTLKKGSSEDDKVKFLQEAAIMGQFKHPNVVTMYGVVTDGEPVLLVLEMLKKGDLRKYLLSMRTDNEGISDEIDDHELLSYCRQVASGMVYLSNKAFVHRDLAARNILVSDDKICKIADFGMSRDLEDENYYVSHGGKIPVKWTAPEALYYKKYSTASDVWSFGVVMYEIWSVGYKPFNKIENAKVIPLVTSGYRLPPPPGCPRAIYSIMMSCWHPKADGRPNFNDVSTQLSVSNSKLLHWTEEDKSKFPEASKLGASLNHSENLYEDIQIKYKNASAKSQLAAP